MGRAHRSAVCVTEMLAQSDVACALDLLYEPGDVFEVRAPKCRERRGSSYTSTVCGYFTHDAIEQAAAAIAELDDADAAPGIYVTLNPVRPDLLARSANRLQFRAVQTTSDADVPTRRWMLIDVDPVRPSGVSATDVELTMSAERAEAIHAYLAGEGWPDPIRAMSGNGHHLLYRINLPADDDGLVKHVLEALAERFGDDAVSVDRSVFNPARIVKLVGTKARKGDDLRGHAGIEDRPHRRSEFIDVPTPIEIVPNGRLEALVTANAPRAAPQAHAIAPVLNERFPTTAAGVRDWLAARGVAVKGERCNGTKTMLLLERCPVDPEIVSTGGSDIAVLVGDDGRLAYCNKHNRGADFTWHDLRRAIDPEYAARPVADPDVDLSGLLGASRTTAGAAIRSDPSPAPFDPGPLPETMLRVPGFIGEVMDLCLATAPYPNRTLAFCGALALQAFLAGRKVRDPADNRTNIYLLGLAHSSAGKDWPRKINSRILHAVGLSNRLADQLASGEGIQDALFATPSLLFQTDEIDGLLQSMKRARDARFESIMATLLTMYSSSNSVYPMRRRANNAEPGVIDQPCLVLFGTAIPNHYYAALSERMLTNGLFARMLVLESGPRGTGQEPRAPDPSDQVIETAAWWANFRPGKGNLAEAHPTPKLVNQTPEAQAMLVDLRERAESEYAKAEVDRDAVATTVWGRVSENARKLALIYAVSECHAEPSIGGDAVRWASELVMHQTKRMLFMAAGHAAENPFDDLVLRLMRVLRAAEGQTLPHSVLLKRMRIDAKTFRQLVETLIERGDLTVEVAKTAGRDATAYRLLGKEAERSGKEGGPKSGL